MRVTDAFPTKYLNAGDLQKQRHALVIANVVIEEGIDKPIIYFRGAKKGLACNKTNAMMIASLYGDETDDWIGKTIELYEAQVMFDNKFVPAIRVQAPPPSMPAHGSAPLGDGQNRPIHPAPDPKAPQGGGGYAADPIDDEIPFIKCIY